MRQDTITTHIDQVKQINAIKANDNKMLKALYHENYYKVEIYVVNNNGSADEARDIYQEAFIAVWRNIQLDKFTVVDGSSVGGYIYRVAKNKWLDHLRSSHRTKVIPIEHSTVNLSHAEPLKQEESDYLLAVKHNFKSLGANCKEVLTRFYYQKQSLKEIAAKFDWTEATARNNKYRCLQRLRDLIKSK